MHGLREVLQVTVWPDNPFQNQTPELSVQV